MPSPLFGPYALGQQRAALGDSRASVPSVAGSVAGSVTGSVTGPAVG
ncbi:hypothetical protein [Streptomyces stelliscabiei]